MIMYDYDVNFMADDATTSPAPRPTSDMPPLPCCLTRSGALAAELCAQFPKLRHQQAG